MITNAAAAHLEGFGSLDGVAKAKCEIYQGLPANGIAIVNQDDHYATFWRTLVSSKKSLLLGLKKQLM